MTTERATCGICGDTGVCDRCDGDGIDPDYREGITSEPECFLCDGTGECDYCGETDQD